MPNTVKEIFEAIIEKRWATFLAIGIALLSVASLGKIPWLGQISNANILNVLVVVGVVLIIFSILLAWFEGETKGISFARPPDIMTSNPPLRFRLTGTVSRKLKRDKLWLFTQGTYRRDRAYWPYKEVEFSSKTEWSIDYETKRYEDDDVRTFCFYLVGLDGQALVQCFDEMNHHFAVPRNEPWLPIIELTSDIRPLGEPFRVTLRKSK